MSLSAAELAFLADAGLTLSQVVEFAALRVDAPKVRTANAERQARFRERHAVTDNVTVTPQNNEMVSSSPSSSSPPIPPLITTTLSPSKTQGTRKAARRWVRQGVMPPGWLDYATEKIPDRQAIATEFEKFQNYWTAKNGKDAAKHDWDATWRNWIIRRTEEQPRRATGNDVTTPSHQRFTGFAASIARDIAHRSDQLDDGPAIQSGEPLPF